LAKKRSFKHLPQRHVPNVIQERLQHALAFHQQGMLSDAKKIYEDILKQQPNHFDALHLLGMIAWQTKNPHQGEELIGKAIKVNPASAAAYSNRGNALRDLKRVEEALASYDRAIALKPDYAEAYNNRGNALRDLKRIDEALVSCDRAIALKPDYAEAYNNRGVALQEVKRVEEALASYDRAIALKPDYADAYNNRGNALKELKRVDEALASYDRAIALKADHAEAYNNRGVALQEAERVKEALASYDRAIALKPDYADAYNNRRLALREHERVCEALASYDRAIAVKADHAEAYHNRGVALKELKRVDEALASYDRAIALNPDFAGTYNNRGNILRDLKRFDEAFASYDKAFALKPESVGVEGARLHTKMHLCDWNNFDVECAHLISSVQNKRANALPFQLLAISSSSADQLQCAKLWIAKNFPSSQESIWRGEHYRHDRIRVAYVSADFREHAVSSLIAGMIERHDKSRFDVIAISLGPDENSEMRRRLKESFEHFIDAKTLSDEEIANLVRSSEVDIMVDLMGFTKDSRTGIFARRAAPIQVNYLGYPGTMGAQYIDYIIADRIVIPESQYEFYSEKIAILPGSYQVNDAKRSISDRVFTRSELGLPPTGFVFCCFNQDYKITPRVFDCWMRILKQVENSVLWLLADNTTAVRNLTEEAAAQGVSSGRLIFAKRMLIPDHLARYRLADLFLDTLPYNAHTTASDALRVGVPVLTCIGDTFAGRVAASVLSAIRLPELITTTLEAYEQMAISLATHREKLAFMKRKLAKNRLTTPLFDTELFTKHIEAAYTAMYERYQAGLAPDLIVIPE
jgi:protein O-GlcNAc transferase